MDPLTHLRAIASDPTTTPGQLVDALAACASLPDFPVDRFVFVLHPGGWANVQMIRKQAIYACDDYAKALAADLVRAADAVEPMVERSCYTCAHARLGRTGITYCDLPAPGPDVVDYENRSGANAAADGLPTDRSIPCPGHAPKVTP